VLGGHEFVDNSGHVAHVYRFHFVGQTIEVDTGTAGSDADDYLDKLQSDDYR
jgi:hypothetical protein